VYEMPTSMISLCQVGQGYPFARWERAFVSLQRHQLAIEPLGGVPAWRRTRHPLAASGRWTFTEDRVSVFLPVPKQFGGGLGRLSSVAQSATAGPGRTRVMICCFVAASGRFSSFSCHYELSAAAVDGEQIGYELPGYRNGGAVGMALLLFRLIDQR
jgi:hypothetical protein